MESRPPGWLRPSGSWALQGSRGRCPQRPKALEGKRPYPITRRGSAKQILILFVPLDELRHVRALRDDLAASLAGVARAPRTSFSAMPRPRRLRGTTVRVETLRPPARSDSPIEKSPSTTPPQPV